MIFLEGTLGCVMCALSIDSEKMTSWLHTLVEESEKTLANDL